MIDDDDDMSIDGYRYNDLLAAKIISGRTDLARKQTDHGFPRPVKTGNRQAFFLKSEVRAWLRERMAIRDAAARPVATKARKGKG
jgi:predicted DNA-binding transcriptional regulator AlpA